RSIDTPPSQTYLTGIGPGGATLTGIVVPGTYDVIIGARTASLSGYSTPRRIVVGTAPVVLRVDITPTAVSGQMTVGGVALGTSTVDAGSVWLENPTSRFLLTGTNHASYAVQIVPGTYDLYYAERTYVEPLGEIRPQVTPVPSNVTAKVRGGIVIPDRCAGGGVPAEGVRLDI